MLKTVLEYRTKHAAAEADEFDKQYFKSSRKVRLVLWSCGTLDWQRGYDWKIKTVGLGRNDFLWKITPYHKTNQTTTTLV